MFDRIRCLAFSCFSVLGFLTLPQFAVAAEMRLENPPMRTMSGDQNVIPTGFPDPRASATGVLRIGQSYTEVRALLLAMHPSTRVSVQNRRFQLRNIRTEPNVMTLLAEVHAPDRSYVERLRLRFTSKMTGQLLYFIHRDVEFRKASHGTQREFAEQMAARFNDSTWSMMAPGFFSFRQIFTDGRMLSWGESQRRPELGGCFMLSGGPTFEAALDEGSLGGAPLVDIARCGGGVDADWRSDIGKFTVTLIDFPLFREDRDVLRQTLEAAARKMPQPEPRAQP